MSARDLDEIHIEYGKHLFPLVYRNSRPLGAASFIVTIGEQGGYWVLLNGEFFQCKFSTDSHNVRTALLGQSLKNKAKQKATRSPS